MRACSHVINTLPCNGTMSGFSPGAWTRALGSTVVVTMSGLRNLSRVRIVWVYCIHFRDYCEEIHMEFAPICVYLVIGFCYFL